MPGLAAGSGSSKKTGAMWADFGAAAAAGATVVALALFDVGPFGGMAILAILGWIGVCVLHGALVALIYNLVRPAPQPTPTTVMGHLSKHNLPDSRLKTLLPLGVALAATALVDGWLATQSLAPVTRVGYVAAAFIGIAVLRLPLRGERLAKYSGSAAGGFVLAILTSLAVLIGSTGYRQTHLKAVSFPPLGTVSIAGSYVSLGDSYAAGEGLNPYEPDTVRSGCDRSQHDSWARLLAAHLAGISASSFRACSGSIIRDVYEAHTTSNGRVLVPAQVDPTRTYPDVGLVTLMSGGNDVGFSKVVQACYERTDCTRTVFTSGKPGMPPAQQMDAWARAALTALAGEEHALYTRIRTSFPNARIIVIGYPYLFTAGSPTLLPNDCASLTRRFSKREREWVRDRIDDVNNLLYDETVATGLEFVSPRQAWIGHEPCGAKGDYTNELRFGQLSGSFHPNHDGAKQIAQLLDSYLAANPSKPDPLIHPGDRAITVGTDLCPAHLGLKAPFGDPTPRCPSPASVG